MSDIGDEGARDILKDIAGLLKNPAVLEAAIACGAAFAASQRIKKGDSDKGSIDLLSVMSMLPRIMPMISLMQSMQTSGMTEADPPSADLPEIGSIPASADEIVPTSESAGGFCEAVPDTKRQKRENLLLAIRPYLSESRTAAIDAMIEAGRVSEMFSELI